MLKKIFFAAFALGIASVGAQAHEAPVQPKVDIESHSGGTDANGCHNDYKKGTWHCH